MECEGEDSSNSFCLDKKDLYMTAAIWKRVNGEGEFGDVKEIYSKQRV